jgi:Transglycosylase SLT domain
MLNSGRVQIVTLPLRKIGSALPAVALLSVGVLLSASAAPTESPDFAVSDTSPAIVVPDVALTQRATPGGVSNPAANGFAATGGGLGVVNPLVPLVPPGTDPNSSTPVTLDSTGIPVRALEAYRLAATLTDSADPGCRIDWALVAAIGRVESDHARFGGNQLDSGGVAQPGIIGIALDGTNGTARITDTDGGVLDRDTTFDRAVGPMQFIPGTWRAAGVDADGDGAKNPQDMADAATATAIYLCSGPGDLSTAGDLRSSILRYNYSDSYVRMVSSIAAAYRQGVNALPASDLAPDRSTGGSEAAASAAATRAAEPPAVESLPPAPSTTKRPTSATPRASATPGPSTSTSTSSPAVPTPSTTTSTSSPAVPTPSTTTTAVPTPVVTTTTTVPTPVVTTTTTTVPPPVVTTTEVPTPIVTTTEVPFPTATCEPTATPPIAGSPSVPEPCLPTPCLPTTAPDVPCVNPDGSVTPAAPVTQTAP